MLLGEILTRDAIKFELQAFDKIAAIDELLRVLVNAGRLPARLHSAAHDAVCAREATAPTGMEMGIALPHGSIPGLNGIVAALGLAPHGIKFGAIDGQPAQCIVLLLLPRDGFHAHVRTLAGISHLLTDDRFREELIHAGSVDEIMQLIQHEEQAPGFFSRLVGR